MPKKTGYNSQGFPTGSKSPSEYPGRREHGVVDRGLPEDVNTPAVSKAAPVVKKEKAKPMSGGA